MAAAGASASSDSDGISKAIAAGPTTYSAYPPKAPFGTATTRLPSQPSAPVPAPSTEPSTSIPGV